MRLLLDMNLTPRWVAFLQARGHSAAHWSDIGPANAKDSEICEFARKNGWIVVTSDLDFPQLLAHTRDGAPSVVLLRGQPLTPESRADALFAALSACQEELTHGAILTINWTKPPRARLLPLK